MTSSLANSTHGSSSPGAAAQGRSAFDVLIVGAGVAGASAAIVLARRGLRVALVDRRERCAPCFKAEKVEPDQADRLRELGLFDAVRPKLTPIESIASGFRGRVLLVNRIEQYGIDYWDLTNAIRDAVPSEVHQRTATVSRIDLEQAYPRVELEGGDVLEARIVVLACGTSPALGGQLGLAYHDVRRPHSLDFGFDVELERGAAGHASLTYYGEDVASRLDYVTLFPIGDRWRANLFTYLDPMSAPARALLRAPGEALAAGFPRLSQLVGRLSVVGRVEAQKVDLYRLDEPARAGLVLIGDAFQSVCPATGTGLSKVLTDVAALCDQLPGWLATPGMGAEKIAGFYADPRKQATDAQSLAWAEHRRSFSTRDDLRWRIHRARTWLGMFVDGRMRGAA